jgi:hypothetical protein
MPLDLFFFATAYQVRAGLPSAARQQQADEHPDTCGREECRGGTLDGEVPCAIHGITVGALSVACGLICLAAHLRRGVACKPTDGILHSAASFA